MRRRTFVKSLGGVLATSIYSRHLPAFASQRYDKVIALGMDGMEISLLRRFIADGKMPTFSKLLAKGGYFGPLKTTLPALSPVAWSSFVTGCNPGKHGIFDFIHRDPRELEPYLATARTIPSSSSLSLGNLRIPFGGETKQTRQSKALWDYLTEHKVQGSFFRMPGNFPTQGGDCRTISGMGTPDATGGYGAATLVLERGAPVPPDYGSSRVLILNSKDFTFEFSLKGPPNPYDNENKTTQAAVKILKDPTNHVVRLETEGFSTLLKQGEWSQWIPINFTFLGAIASASAMVQVFVRRVHPELEIYISPVLVDPLTPAVPVSIPHDYAAEMAQSIGRFNTLGLPADTKSLANGLLDDQDYLHHAHSVLDENFKSLDFELKRFHEGLLFFYFSSLDQNQHMLWRCFDHTHPQYDPNASAETKSAVENFYLRMDEALAKTMQHVDDKTLLLILSDHGFKPFTREFHLNNWLHQHGYLVVKGNSKDLPDLGFGDIDWARTKAYATGFAGLFINLAEREKFGIVAAADSSNLISEICAGLKRERDPLNGQSIGEPIPSSVAYNGDFVTRAPDIVMSYSVGYRVSDESVLGGFGKEIVGHRTNKWSADHCMDPAQVPGLLISNAQITSPEPAIWDLAPTILSVFGIAEDSSLFDGKNLKVT